MIIWTDTNRPSLLVNFGRVENGAWDIEYKKIDGEYYFYPKVYPNGKKQKILKLTVEPDVQGDYSVVMNAARFDDKEIDMDEFFSSLKNIVKKDKK